MKVIYTILTSLVLISCNERTSKAEAIITSGNTVEVKIEQESEEKQITSQKTYILEDIEITLTQTKSHGKDFFCESKLLVSKDAQLIDSLTFTPEPVGGYYGISKPTEVENHLVFTKHGDYDGRTLIVNNRGRIFNIIGGDNFYDPESKMLFTIYDSDLTGFAVFDLKTDTVVLEMSDIEDRPLSFHKAFGERYFMLSSNDESGEGDRSVWENEFDMNRIMQVDLDTAQINHANILKTWTLEEINCECEK